MNNVGLNDSAPSTEESTTDMTHFASMLSSAAAPNEGQTTTTGEKGEAS